MGEIDNNKGYYQDVDDARYEYSAPEDEKFEVKKVRPYGGLPQERYSGIVQTDFSLNGRTKFCMARHQIHKEAERQYHADLRNGTYKNLPDTQVFCQCKNCKGGFIAKKADRKRGWAKFCSKSCKAQY